MSRRKSDKIYPGGAGKKRNRKYVVTGLILFAVFSIVKVWQNVRIDQVVRYNQESRMELKRLQNESSLLTLQYEFLTSIDRIERLAKEKLGFIPAQKMNIELNP